MNYVVDFNILYSSLLSGKSFYRILFKSYNLYAPDFIFIELQKYEKQIIENTKLDFKQLIIYSKFIFSYLKVFPNLVISLKSKQQAYDLCKGIDLKDITYIALSIELDIPLITRDELLLKGLKKKGFKNLIPFNNFVGSNKW